MGEGGGRGGVFSERGSMIGFWGFFRLQGSGFGLRIGDVGCRGQGLKGCECRRCAVNPKS